jgi:hypothetical protein
MRKQELKRRGSGFGTSGKRNMSGIIDVSDAHFGTSGHDTASNREGCVRGGLDDASMLLQVWDTAIESSENSSVVCNAEAEGIVGKVGQERSPSQSQEPKRKSRPTVQKLGRITHKLKLRLS